ncbi:MAG: sigma-70 family RNA polymerase sigma factor [Jatrophihabitans sp.]|nr:MAG: sigma-70 family RNA polymerase sigma factor [Jatrophihabitans sp.]
MTAAVLAERDAEREYRRQDRPAIGDDPAPRDGRPAADVDDLVRTHLPLVGHLVRELLGRLPAHVHRDDLISAGMFALATSAQAYDASRGVPFARFAAIRIRGALTDELRSMDWASRAVRGRAREVEAARDELAAHLGRMPRREEIASSMKVDVAQLDAVDADVHRASLMSLQGLTDDCGGDLFADGNAGPEALLLQREQLGLLRDAVAELPERLRLVVDQYFFCQRKMADIARELGVTESRVSQLRSEALAMLRAGLRAQDCAAPDPIATGRRRGAALATYAQAIAARSTFAERLAATTVLGEVRPRVVAVG